MNVFLRNVGVAFIAVLMLAGGVSGCEEGPAERAGDAIDDVGRDIGDATEDAVDEVEDAFDG